MKKGDKVNVVDENGTFIIKKIEEGKVILLDEHGFEAGYSIKQVVPYRSLDDLEIGNIREIKKEDIKKVNDKLYNTREDTREIDLHIGHLVDSLRDLQPHKMLQKQINVASLEIERAKKDKIKKLILIHGKGKGVLKEKIYQLLQSIDNIEYFEADIIKYRFGAVEIRFK